MIGSHKMLAKFAVLALALTASMGVSADEINQADTAWILTSTALVLFIPFLAFRCFMPVWCAAATCCQC